MAKKEQILHDATRCKIAIEARCKLRNAVGVIRLTKETVKELSDNVNYNKYLDQIESKLIEIHNMLATNNFE